MEAIYFEKQEGLLCAQHCLNALLQGQYFTPVDLAKIAHDLDDEERQTMRESGEDSEDYRRFIQQPSQNMDDSGYFSVQVISRCLGIWGLELVRYGSTEEKAIEAKNCPQLMNAYICNYKDHWFTIRKIGCQWFNLNSVSKKPKLISDTFLSLLLAQLQQEGYSIFIVVGDLPQCEADIMLLTNPVKHGTTAPPSSPNRLNDISEDVQMDNDDGDFPQSLELSLRAESDRRTEDEDLELKRAIELSLRTSPIACSSGLPSHELNESTAMEEGAVGGCEDMDAELEAAVRLKLDCSDS